MNLDRKILNLRGIVLRDKIDGEMVDLTVKEVLLNSLTVYPIKRKSEVFEVNSLATTILDKATEFSERETQLLKDSLHNATFRIENGEEKGVYRAMVMGQVYEELGIKD